MEQIHNVHIDARRLIKHYAEVESMVLSSFDQENHDRILQEYYRKQGIEQSRLDIVKRMLSQGLTADEIEKLTGISKDFILNGHADDNA